MEGERFSFWLQDALIFDKGARLAKSVRVRISQRSLVLLGMASKLKMSLGYFDETLHCCQNCKKNPSTTPSEAGRFLAWDLNGIDFNIFEHVNCY